MPKSQSAYICQHCGSESKKWQGRCEDCGEWNTLVESLATPKASKGKQVINDGSKPIPITQTGAQNLQRVVTGLGEFDRLLGGGIVPGSAILVGGDPGIGKSTLVLQVCASVGKAGKRVLYVSAEESAQQIGLRAQRMGVDHDNVLVFTHTNVKTIEEQVHATKADLVIIDSIQLIYTEEVTSAAGTVAQIRETSATLVYMAKRLNIPVIIIGHVTKDGALAGPKILEHLVDTVLYFMGDQQQDVRILRAIKNRFGSTNEIGVFDMTEAGLMPIQDPSLLFTSQTDAEAPGRILSCVREGNRSLFLEVQALTCQATMGMPKRKATGMDSNRLAMIVAILEKHVGLQLASQDVYVNIVGGIRVDEPALDLAAALAIASSFRNVALGPWMAVGELGLTGEIRPVRHLEQRLSEAKRFGIENAIIPPPAGKSGEAVKQKGLKLSACRRIQDAVDAVLR